MKIIFLDIHGVLISLLFKSDIKNHRISKENSISIAINDNESIIIEKIKYIKQIVDRTGAKIVLISELRNFKKDTDRLNNIFKMFDLEIFSITPLRKHGGGEEITRFSN